MQILNIAGGKKRIAPWIISHFPEHRLYCEPFGGSGAVLLAKAPSALEVYNDVNPNLVLFFQTLCSRPEELLEAIDRSLYASVLDTGKTSDVVELARRFFVKNNTTWSHSGVFKSQARVTQTSRTVATVFAERKAHLQAVAERIRHVVFESRDGLEIIQKYDGPESLFYVDPPYFGNRKADLYEHEMMDEPSHRALAAVLRECQGAVVLSGYASELYNQFYSDWPVFTKNAQTNAKDFRQECLWVKTEQQRNSPVKRSRKLKWDDRVLRAVGKSDDGLSFVEILHALKLPPRSLTRTLRRLELQKHLDQNTATQTFRVSKMANNNGSKLSVSGHN